MSSSSNQSTMASGSKPNFTCAFIAFTRRGCDLATAIATSLKERGAYAGASVSVHGPERFADACGIEPYQSLGAWTAEQFEVADALVFVSATGIAVRAIAPHVRDKFHDPAVVSVDEAGRFVVPLLSGHVGGANGLARAVADVCGGQAVISPATDVNELFAVDEWAARRGYAIVERVIAKEISARLLSGETMGFASDFELGWDPPAGVIAVGQASGGSLEAALQGGRPEVGFAVSLDDACQPFTRTLHLVPQAVTVGVGCRKDADPAALEQAVGDALAKARISPLAVRLLSSIDVKKDEAAILQLAAKHGWATRFYTADELNAVPGDFAASDFVRRTVGVDNVCERAALAQGGRLLLGKQAGNGTTVAIAFLEGDSRR